MAHLQYHPPPICAALLGGAKTTVTFRRWLAALCAEVIEMKRLFLTVAIANLMVGGAQAQTKTIPHYRKSYGVILVCQEVPLAQVKKIDELAKGRMRE
jgi:hypothetical protein